MHDHWFNLSLVYWGQRSLILGGKKGPGKYANSSTTEQPILTSVFVFGGRIFATWRQKKKGWRIQQRDY
jgi:hypothetical protein